MSGNYLNQRRHEMTDFESHPIGTAQRIADAEEGLITAYMAGIKRGKKISLEKITKLEKRLAHTNYWYSNRYAQLYKWAREKLTDEQRHGFFDIIANGTANPEDPPTYAQQYNHLKWKVSELESENNELRHDLERQIEIATKYVNEVDRLRIALDPRRWDCDMNEAWHKNIPDIMAAFRALREFAKDND